MQWGQDYQQKHISSLSHNASATGQNKSYDKPKSNAFGPNGAMERVRMSRSVTEESRIPTEESEGMEKDISYKW